MDHISLDLATRTYFNCLQFKWIRVAMDNYVVNEVSCGMSDLVANRYNIISMDAAIFRVWAKLMHKTSDTLYEDAMISATAKFNHLIVVTRNIADFRSFGVKLFNPFDGASY
jgi:predicted nucleic acid-binding protein